jgi:hypothetical protein
MVRKLCHNRLEFGLIILQIVTEHVVKIVRDVDRALHIKIEETAVHLQKLAPARPVRLPRSTVIESTSQADRDHAPRTAHALRDATTAKLVVELATTDLLVRIRLDVQLPPGIVIDVEALLTGASIFLEHKTPQAVLRRRIYPTPSKTKQPEGLHSNADQSMEMSRMW